MIKQTHKPIQSTKSRLINILRDMEAKHLKSAAIYDMDSEENVFPSIGGCTSFCSGERFQQKNRK